MLAARERIFQPSAALPFGRLGAKHPLSGRIPQLHGGLQSNLDTPGAVLIDSYGSAVKKTSIEAVRKDLHWEEHGEILPLPRGVNATSGAVHWQEHGEVLPRDRQAAAEAVAAMGGSRVTFRVPWGRHSKEARPMLSYAEGRWPSLPDGEDCLRTTPAFFWRIADGNYDVAPLGNNWTVHGTGSRWKSASTAGYDLGENAGCRWCIGANRSSPIRSPRWVETRRP